MFVWTWAKNCGNPVVGFWLCVSHSQRRFAILATYRTCTRCKVAGRAGNTHGLLQSCQGHRPQLTFSWAGNTKTCISLLFLQRKCFYCDVLFFAGLNHPPASNGLSQHRLEWCRNILFTCVNNIWSKSSEFVFYLWNPLCHLGSPQQKVLCSQDTWRAGSCHCESCRLICFTLLFNMCSLKCFSWCFLSATDFNHLLRSL